MNGLGYYTTTEPQVDTWETPYPIAFPEEDVSPVPGWGFNPLLAGPEWIAVGDVVANASTSSIPGPIKIGAALGVLALVMGPRNQRWMLAATAVGAGVAVALFKKGGA